MAEVLPFRGFRYNDATGLDAVVAPPYDVLTPAAAAALRARSPRNATHVDLPVLPGEKPSGAAYAAAADTFRTWQADGTLVRDQEPSISIVDQVYRGPDGLERTRRGFIARLRLADFSERIVLPHERTHAGPKVDRLELYRAAHADLSQIFLLYPDDGGAVTAALAEAAAPLMAGAREARDGDGNTHRIAPLAGGGAAHIAGLLHDQRLYIADGHHRYETALAYRDERRAAGDHSADTMMVYLCSMNDPGLTVFPTHRLVKGIDVPPMAAVLGRLQPAFAMTSEQGTDAAGRAAFSGYLATAADPGKAFGLYFPREQRCCTIELRDAAELERLTGEGFSATAAGLSVSLLHYLVLRDALGIDPAHTEGIIDYVSDPAEAFRRLAAGGYGLGAFLNATRVDEVRAIADNGEVMPQKSTYFYPKLLTGLVYDALDAKDDG